ncbi:hypothetical protein FM103_12210 [Corynebacterium xerosis]|uniref:Uncharacterized protein n=1 Tax=Mycetocola reblochoni REB411 TaxID=1255698 RepID=A0A1R4JKH4_9MICO|nr:hypothetical protein FM119_07960 [Mycetocola reblochoni REB411]SLN02445.1 hypothetical protein FM103_12210 [Corynebacterium xerosis]
MGRRIDPVEKASSAEHLGASAHGRHRCSLFSEARDPPDLFEIPREDVGTATTRDYKKIDGAVAKATVDIDGEPLRATDRLAVQTHRTHVDASVTKLRPEAEHFPGTDCIEFLGPVEEKHVDCEVGRVRSRTEEAHRINTSECECAAGV